MVLVPDLVVVVGAAFVQPLRPPVRGPEVSELAHPVRRHEHVGRLDVAVDHGGRELVQVREPGKRVGGVVFGRAFGELLGFVEDVLHGAPPAVLAEHLEFAQGQVHARTQVAHHVGALRDLRQDVNLGLHALQVPFALHIFGREVHDFHRDEPPALGVHPFVHFGGGPGTDQLQALHLPGRVHGTLGSHGNRVLGVHRRFRRHAVRLLPLVRQKPVRQVDVAPVLPPTFGIHSRAVA
mmetsp:Transcript_19636/g.40347  ORF Transcript_19636/g.40347 Transcript_19636/m.40347 type:complete len:237 (+) Transcript_19636:659-1369(+)